MGYFARFNVGARCPKCDGPIEVGDEIEHPKGKPWQHVNCLEARYMTADVPSDSKEKFPRSFHQGKSK